ncbi:hypothetical protein CEF21_21305 [Bacillus sp. FJAT-42376]|uniref:hypothetical protein n=1 Tax=Bacillus sp. FJAT-42376 TaxID=2014076 RepID=UPI000F4D929D|nr:hypothetical protein [Bacillus sp. FJAT-42376]AZB44620.1 hypothetical protein CEF21_21305 [Bacillus sp. FJAT-42376]
MLAELIANAIKNTVLILLTVQCTYAACFIIMGDTLFEQYENGLFTNAANIFTKTWNFIVVGLLGAAPYLYKRKVLKYNWFVKRILFSLWVLLMILAAVIIYFTVSSFLDLLQKGMG